jgi:cytochrome c-type protein NapB
MRARTLLAILILCRAASAGAGDGRMQPFAPPPIPHAAHPDAACTDCHGGRRQDGIPAIPHQVRGWCQSCHVYDTNAVKGGPRARTARSPSPLSPPQGVQAEPGHPVSVRGARAFPGAPPAIPHPVLMRENCQACHGRERHPGMRRNPHPGRADCKSCHLP